MFLNLINQSYQKQCIYMVKMATYSVNVGTYLGTSTVDSAVKSNDSRTISNCFGCRKTPGKRPDMHRERVKQHSMWQMELDASKDKEYRKRRRIKGDLRKLRRRQTKRVRLLFVPTTLLVCIGIGIITVGILPGVAKDSFIKRNATTLHIIGPSVLGCGVILFMITEILVAREQRRKRKDAIELDQECEDNKRAIRQEPYELVNYYKNTYEKAEKENRSVLYQMLSGQLSVTSADGHTVLDPLLCQAMYSNTKVDVLDPLNRKDGMTQTDDELLWKYLQEHVDLESSGQWKKKKVCKMESVESADYSMVSANTQYTDIDEVSDDEISEDEPLLRFTPAPISKPLEEMHSPLITVQFHSSKNDVTLQELSDTHVQPNTVADVHLTKPLCDSDEYYQYAKNTKPLRLGEPIPVGTRPLFIDKTDGPNSSLAAPKSPINISVPNLLLELPPEIEAVPSPRRASWTTFD